MTDINYATVSNLQSWTEIIGKSEETLKPYLNSPSIINAAISISSPMTKKQFLPLFLSRIVGLLTSPLSVINSYPTEMSLQTF